MLGIRIFSRSFENSDFLGPFLLVLESFGLVGAICIKNHFKNNDFSRSAPKN